MSNVNVKWINLVFCIDKSGSMSPSKDEVTSGFLKFIDDQRKIEDGKVTVSLYTFNDDVTECFIGKDIKEIDGLTYYPRGVTKLNDGVGTAIDKVGEFSGRRGPPSQPLAILVASL